MADTKLSALTALAVSPATGDELYIRDISEAAANESKKITADDLMFGGATTPTTQAHGDSAATGSAIEAARIDHKHGMPAAGGGAMALGTYTGDGGTAQAITGIGFLPKALWISRVATSQTVVEVRRMIFTTAQILDNNAAGGLFSFGDGTAGQASFETGGVVSLDSDGFTVDDNGANEDPNESGGPTYDFVCWS